VPRPVVLLRVEPDVVRPDVLRDLVVGFGGMPTSFAVYVGN
jgi:hypothetical protein